MSHQTYTFSITDFPNDAIYIPTFEASVRDVINTPLGYTTLHDDTVKINFTQALSGTEQTDLDYIVATHDGTPYISINVIVEERVSTFSSTASAYTPVLTLSVSGIGEGRYRLLWFVIYGIDSSAVNFRMRIQQNDTVTKVEYIEEVPSSDPDERVPRSGFLTLDLEPGDYHWDIECGKEEDGEEAWKVFKAFLELRRLDD